jgi:hypothetical protein
MLVQNSILWKTVTVYNEHKPLETIFQKPLLSAPMRLQRMLMQLQWYDLTVKYKQGSDMQLPDTLSRAVTKTIFLTSEDSADINVVDYLSITDELYNEMKKFTGLELTTVRDVILQGWPRESIL